MRFADKVAIVSGGGTGIGEAAARRLSSEGASVVVTGRRRETIEQVAADIGGLAVQGDVADPGHATAVVEAAINSYGGLDVVVANAGLGYGGSAGDVSDETWAHTLDVNVSGAMYLVRAAIPRLIERGGGSIVLVSSVSGHVAAPSSAAYVTSKAALIGLAKSIAVDFGRSGIRANALCPGWIRTAMGDDAADELAAAHRLTRDEAYAQVTRYVPLARVGEPGEIAACVAFLASDDASYVTGAAILADGGTLAVDAASLAFDDYDPVV